MQQLFLDDRAHSGSAGLCHRASDQFIEVGAFSLQKKKPTHLDV
ncbi:hypothetical protein [Chromohalobacter nigrandesensis]|nr:hypothetical protein [Chromohalobacter nigrandesensis]